MHMPIHYTPLCRVSRSGSGRPSRPSCRRSPPAQALAPAGASKCNNNNNNNYYYYYYYYYY